MSLCTDCHAPASWRCLRCREDICDEHQVGHVCADLVPDETDLYDPEDERHEGEG
jgi:hypothetical protein